MRIAVPYENGSIFQHFGRTAAFKLYDAEDGEVRASARAVQPTAADTARSWGSCGIRAWTR